MFLFHRQNKIFIFQRILAVFTAMAFSASLISAPSMGYAQTVLNLPVPGTMVALSPNYTPAIMAGMTLYPENPLQLDFMIDTGDDHLEGEVLKKESQKLISYFMAALTVPEDKMWVNLSPYEKDRVMADGLGQTVLGQDMLAQDYILKQLSASMMHPEGETGKQFWQKVYQESKEKLGTTDIPTDTFNKIWIVPDKAVVYTKGTNIFVADSHLKVMLEEDYVALQHHDQGLDAKKDNNNLTEETNKILREIVIPQIEKEVNEGKNFANLRQIYHALILATWYKTNLKESLLGKVYVNQNKTQGVETEDKEIKLKIYNQYLEAFKKGSYDYIKEDYDPATQQVIARKYFSGGEDFSMLGEVNEVEDIDHYSEIPWLRKRSDEPKVRASVSLDLSREEAVRNDDEDLSHYAEIPWLRKIRNEGIASDSVSTNSPKRKQVSWSPYGYRVITKDDPFFYSPSFAQALTMADGIVRTNFFDHENQAVIDEQIRRWKDTVADVVVIGAGPGGLSAGIHAVDEGFKTVVFERGYVAETFSDAYMKQVHWMRSGAVTTSLVEAGISSQRLLEQLNLAKPSNLTRYRTAGNEARKIMTEVTGEQFIGQPQYEEDNTTNMPIARNELFQHFMDVANAIENKGGFIIEQDPVVDVRQTEDGNFVVSTKSGRKQVAKNVIYAPGFVGEKGQGIKFPKIIKELAEKNPDKYITFSNSAEDLQYAESDFQNKQPIVTAPALGNPVVRNKIKSMPPETHFAVVGSGESAVKSVIEIFNLNPLARVQVFMKEEVRDAPIQVPLEFTEVSYMLRALQSQRLREESLRHWREDFGVSITPQTRKDMEAAVQEGRLIVNDFGGVFDADNYVFLPLNNQGGLQATEIHVNPDPTSNIRREYERRGIRLSGINGYRLDVIDGMIVVATGYDKSGNKSFNKMLTQNGIAFADHNGDIILNLSDGMTSRLNDRFYVGGAFVTNQGSPIDSAVRGIVFRSGKIVQNIKNSRYSSSPIDQRRLLSIIYGRYRNFDGFIPELRPALIRASFLPGQSVASVRSLYRTMGNLVLDEQALVIAVLAAAQPGMNPETIQERYLKLRWRISEKARATLVLASTLPAQTIENINRIYLYIQDHVHSTYLSNVILTFAAAHPGQKPHIIADRFREFYRLTNDSVDAANLVLASIQSGQNIDLMKREFRNLVQNGYSISQAANLILASATPGFSLSEAKNLYRVFRQDGLSDEVSQQLTLVAPYYLDNPSGSAQVGDRAMIVEASRPNGSINISFTPQEIQKLQMTLGATRPYYTGYGLNDLQGKWNYEDAGVKLIEEVQGERKSYHQEPIFDLTREDMPSVYLEKESVFHDSERAFMIDVEKADKNLLVYLLKGSTRPFNPVILFKGRLNGREVIAVFNGDDYKKIKRWMSRSKLVVEESHYFTPSEEVPRGLLRITGKNLIIHHNKAAGLIGEGYSSEEGVFFVGPQGFGFKMYMDYYAETYTWGNTPDEQKDPTAEQSFDVMAKEAVNELLHEYSVQKNGVVFSEADVKAIADSLNQDPLLTHLRDIYLKSDPRQLIRQAYESVYTGVEDMHIDEALKEYVRGWKETVTIFASIAAFKQIRKLKNLPAQEADDLLAVYFGFSASLRSLTSATARYGRSHEYTRIFVGFILQELRNKEIIDEELFNFMTESAEAITWSMNYEGIGDHDAYQVVRGRLRHYSAYPFIFLQRYFPPHRIVGGYDYNESPFLYAIRKVGWEYMVVAQHVVGKGERWEDRFAFSDIDRVAERFPGYVDTDILRELLLFFFQGEEGQKEVSKVFTSLSGKDALKKKSSNDKLISSVYYLSYLKLKKLKETVGLSDVEFEALLAEMGGYFKQIEQANESAGRDDQKIDMDGLLETYMPGLANLQVISPQLAKQVVSNAVDRGFMPILMDQLRVLTVLKSEHVKRLRDYYLSPLGKRHRSNPDYLFQLIGFISAYEQMGISIDRIQEVLNTPDSPQDIVKKLGKVLIKSLAEKLDVKIDLSGIIESDDVLAQFDFSYLGLLISTRRGWRDEDQRYFSLILRFTLEGKFRTLVDPDYFDLINLEAFEWDVQKAIQEIRQHNLNMIKIGSENGIQANAFLHPEQILLNRPVQGESRELRASDLLKDFVMRYNAFQKWAKDQKFWNDDNPAWQTKDLPANWQMLVEHPESLEQRVGTIKTVDLLQKFQEFLRRTIDRIQQGVENDQLEKLFDMQIIIDQMLRFNRGETLKSNGTGFTIGFWERMPGKDMFVGNCAGSCTAIGSNATAVFEFLLDLGTQYVLIRDNSGKARGYARFFFAKNEDGTVSLYVDSVDGISAYHYKDQMLTFIKDFAEKIGLDPNRVHDRTTGEIKSKLGQALTSHYFHHSYGSQGWKMEVDKSNAAQGGDKWEMENDNAMLNTKSPDYGGIDFNANNLNLESQGEAIQFNLPKDLRGIDPSSVNGITPVIINISPIINFPFLLGLSEKMETEKFLLVNQNK